MRGRSAGAIADYRVGGRDPRYVVRPASVEAVQGLLREISAAGDAVIVQGGRTSIVTGNPAEGYDVALDMTALDAVIAHEPDDFTVTVQTGMRFDVLQTSLTKHGQFLPLDPARASETTIGGMIARGRGGLRRGAFGGVRDWLIGCTAVLSDGRAVHGGGRVVKNVSGYDLPKLFAGSWGTLGCIVEASFKLRPLPAYDATLRIPAPDFATAVGTGSEIAQGIAGLQAVIALDAATATAAGVEGGLEGEAVLLIRSAGMAPVVAETMAATRAHARASTATDSISDPALWERLADLTAPDEESVLVRVGLPPPAVASMSGAAGDAMPEASRMAVLDGGLLFLRADRVEVTAVQALRATATQLGGALTVESGLPPGLDAWGEASGLPIMRRVKAEFDPTRTLSPGRFVAGLEG